MERKDKLTIKLTTAEFREFLCDALIQKGLIGKEINPNLISLTEGQNYCPGYTITIEHNVVCNSFKEMIKLSPTHVANKEEATSTPQPQQPPQSTIDQLDLR